MINDTDYLIGVPQIPDDIARLIHRGYPPSDEQEALAARFIDAAKAVIRERRPMPRSKPGDMEGTAGRTAKRGSIVITGGRGRFSF